MTYKSKGLRKKSAHQNKKHHTKVRAPLFLWPDSDIYFEKKLKEFGYRGDSDGVCHGVACVAVHAMLLNQIDQFDHQLMRIRELSPDANQNQYQERAFFEAVEINHQPKHYPHLFSRSTQKPGLEISQHILHSMPLIESEDVSQQGGVVIAGKFSGVYDRSELINCLTLLRRGIEKFPCPVSMLLSDDGHIIAVQYHATEKTWILVDSRQLPSRRFGDEAQLARAIANTLTPKLKKTVMSAIIVATREHESLAKKAFIYTCRLRGWKKIQGIDETKNRYLMRWLFIAAFEGCEKEVAFLLTHHVDPNRPIIHGATPLTISSYQGYTEVVKLLLKFGARPNINSHGVESPLYNALVVGNEEIAALIRAAGGNLKKEERTQLAHLI